MIGNGSLLLPELRDFGACQPFGNHGACWLCWPIAWVEPIVDRHHPAALIGLEVSTSSGDWRTCRLPAPLLCPLPRERG
jgi:hypothetical protein